MTIETQAPHPEEVFTRRGGKGVIYVRDGTSDLSLALGTFSNSWATGDDEYNLADLFIDGVFVDVGSHIGVVSLAVLLDNPNVRAILVEPFPENLALARSTMAANGLADRVTYVEAAVGNTTIRYGTTEDDRYVGNIATHAGQVIEAPLLTLVQLVKMAGGQIDAMKLDCEGGEWKFLASRAIRDVRLLFGEWHGNTKRRIGADRLRSLLEATHDITLLTDVGGIGLFRAVRR